jgi:cobalt-zinc-cadmium resistance protein CzcA
MVRLLIRWALNNPLVVILLSVALVIFGVYAFLHVNVEAYPDPAPPLIEVIAQFPGGSAEEVERQVTVPLEVTLAGMPGLKTTRSQSLFGLSDVKCQFEYGTDYLAARQEVINRLQFTQPLPPGVQPQLSPESPTGEIYRYSLNCPKDGSGKDLYTLNDLKALQDWVLEREFRRVPRIVDVTSFGGTVKRYEIHPDPDRMKQLGITLGQVQAALTNANANVGADYVIQGPVAMNVRSIGLFGGGRDPVSVVLGMDKQALDAYQDACLAEALGLLRRDQRDALWQLLAEKKYAATADTDGKAVNGDVESGEKGLRRVAGIVERLRLAADGQKVDPPLSEEEQKQADAFQRLRAALVRAEEDAEQTPGVLDRLRAALGQKKESGLAPEEQRLVDEARRVVAGYSSRALSPSLTEEEKGEVDRLRRWVAARASARLREEEGSRIREIRNIVITSVNNRDILLEDIVEGGRLQPGERPGDRGVVVGHQTRLGRVSQARPQQVQTAAATYRVVDSKGRLAWRDEEDKVECIVLLRKNEDSLPALKDVEAKVAELNDPSTGKMLPGVVIEPYYDRTELINVTTDTVQENLLVGIMLVVVILFMFISNVRAAFIVAINIPLALLFAFAVLFLRGKSANLLSIGAVDFGIIVDSTVIMVENIYRHISSGEYRELPLKERILHACHEVETPLLFSTLIMVCAFIPLFTMSGPEGQIFGPMAHTYAFALAGALMLALTLAPVMCLLLFKHLKPAPDNFLVAWLKNSYLRQLDRVLRHRYIALALFAVIIGFTGAYALPRLGHEFMPELEEGNLWVRGRFPLNVSLDRVTENADEVRHILCSYPEVETAVVQIGRPDDGTDVAGFYNIELFVPLLPQKEWPKTVEQTGWRRWLHGAKRAPTKEELVKEMNAELSAKLPGADFNFSQNIRDNVMESLSGVKGDNSVKIFGPDLEKLDDLAEKMRDRLQKVPGVVNVGVFSIKGQTNMEFRVDLEKCRKWGVSANDVNTVIQTALGGKAYSTMIEGEKQFDITVRWPQGRRGSETDILDIPVDISNNQVVLAAGPSATPNPLGTGMQPPAVPGSPVDTRNPISNTPRRTLRDFVTPVGPNGKPDPHGHFVRSGASTIYREQSQRLIAVKFSVRDRDLGGAVAEAREKTKDLFQSPYRSEWSGEFEEMEQAEGKLLWIIPLSLGLIFVLLYIAFRSVVDALLVFANVVALSLGGIWALLLTGTNFSISAAVGFVSIFGVAIMDGLLLVSYFNRMRAHGMPLRDSILEGASKRVRPVMMTALTAVFGLLPAAFSDRIGAQTQRPLAIVVVGGMVTTLFLTRYLMPLLYSFYGHREPPEGAGGMAH